MNLRYADPTEWWLEVSPQVEAESWRASRTRASRPRQSNYYLNQLCMGVFLPWFQAEYAPEATVWPDRRGLARIWEFVNGVSARLGNKRIVLLPSEGLESSEIEVPQEWVDIPTWAADYYLAAQLNPEESWLRVWGYTTHEQLRRRADYDPEARSYCLAGEGLIRDLSAFWTTCRLCPEATTQGNLAELPSLSTAAADQLICQLSQPGIGFPRLTAPFADWAALMARADWRHQLYDRRLTRLGQEALVRPVVKLNQWFEQGVLSGWQTIESFLGGEPQAAASFRGITAASGANEQRVKLIELSNESEPQAVLMMMELTTEPDGRVGVRVQIHPPKGRRHVPEKLTLAIYSAADELLLSIRSRQHDDYIQLPNFRCLPGTEFRLKVGLGEDCFSENFIV